jgi:rubredoxin
MMYKCKPSKGNKAKAWRAFADYIKIRDCLSTTGDTERFKCYTCGKIFDKEYGDASHAIGGRTNSILFDEDIVKLCCRSCNRLHGGEYQMFKYKLIQEHGEVWWTMKEQAKRTTTQYTEFDYELIAKRYREMTKRLKEEHGL